MGFDLDNVETSIAVVGATDDLSKYGARIYRDLKAKGYRVFYVDDQMNITTEFKEVI